MTDKIKLVKCYFLRVFAPPTRASQLFELRYLGEASLVIAADGWHRVCARYAGQRVVGREWRG